MKFETIILLVIAFNVVTAILKQRAKKARERQKAAAQAAASLQPPSGRAAPPRSVSPEDEAEEALEAEWNSGEHTHSDAGHDWDAEEHESAPETVAPPAPHGNKGAAGLGRDLLEKLARELGLKLPSPSPKPSPDPVTVSVSVKAPPRPPAPRGGEGEATAPVITAKTEIPEPKKAGLGPRFASRLRDPAEIREAFVLREILGPPRALRKR